MRYPVTHNTPRYSIVERSRFLNRPLKVRLEEDLIIEYRGEKLVVPAGFVTDGASIPWYLRWLCGNPFKFPRVIAAIEHDFIYSGKALGWSRAEADDLYRDLQIGLAIKRVFAIVEWAAVRKFGRKHWDGAKDLATFLLAASLLALCTGCQTTFDKTRNGEVSGASIDDGGFKAGTIELQSVSQGESAILAVYSEDSSIFSPGNPTRDVRLTIVGDATQYAPEIFKSLCEAFKAAKESKFEASTSAGADTKTSEISRQNE